FSANYGISDHDDGQRTGASFVFGQTSDKGSILAGVDYNKQDGISSSARDFSKLALYRYYGTIYAFGSSRNPFGRAILSTKDSSGADATAPTQGVFGCSSVTRKAPGAGPGQSLSDYRCYTGADSYNYQAVNWDLVPQERTNGFFKGDYQLTDNVQVYATFMHNKTTASSALAALPFDAFSDGVIISKD